MHASDRAAAAVAAKQENVISRRQMLASGVGRGAIGRRVSAGTLQVIYHGVYLMGPAAPTRRARARAAVFACGDTAVVSHRTAAELWGLLPAGIRDPDVTVVGRNPRRQAGIRLHRTRHLPHTEVGQIGGIPVTSVARTICDLAATEPVNDVEHALQEARVHHHVTDAQLRAVIERAPTRAGAALVRRLLNADVGTGYTRSRAERLMRSLIRKAGLSLPAVNVLFEGHLLDFVWHEQRLVVEVDGYEFHGNRASFEADRRRDQVLVAAGYRVIRITWRQLVEEPFAVIARLAQALAVPTSTAA